MEKLELDVGLQEYQIAGGGVLRFNPSDPALYGRFAQGQTDLATLEHSLLEQAKAATPQGLLKLMEQADTKAKEILNRVFGCGNDFHKALGGVSLLAVCRNGKTVAENLFSALEKVLEKGTQRLVDKKISEMGETL